MNKEDIELKNIDGYIKELENMREAVITDLQKRTLMVQYTICGRCQTPLYPSPKENEGIKWHEAKIIIERHHQECKKPFPSCSKCARFIYNDEEPSRIGIGFFCPSCMTKYQVDLEDR